MERQAHERLLISAIYYFGSEAMQRALECDFKPSDMLTSTGRRFYEIALQMHEKQTLLTGLDTYGEECLQCADLTPADFANFTSAHAWDLIPSMHVPKVCRELKRRAAQRKIATTAKSIEELINSGDEEGVSVALLSIQETQIESRPRLTWEQVAKSQIAKAQAIIAGRPDESDSTISWPWPELDREFKPMHRGELVVLAGFTSYGKSSLCRQLCLWAAMHEFNSAAVSMEVSAGDMFNLMSASVSGQPWSRLSGLHPNDQQAFLRGQEKVRSANIQILDSTLALPEILAWIRSQNQKRFLDVVAIDYLGLISECDPQRGETKAHSVGKVVASFKRLAMELKCVVLLAVQTSRGHVSDGNRPPRLTDLKDSGDIEAHADRVILLHRPNRDRLTDEEQNTHDDIRTSPRFYMEIFQEKGRNVGTGSGALYLRRELARFELPTA